MKLRPLRFRATALALAVLAAPPLAAAAEAGIAGYPSRPIRLVSLHGSKRLKRRSILSISPKAAWAACPA